MSENIERSSLLFLELKSLLTNTALSTLSETVVEEVGGEAGEKLEDGAFLGEAKVGNTWIQLRKSGGAKKARFLSSIRFLSTASRTIANPKNPRLLTTRNPTPGVWATESNNTWMIANIEKKR